MTSIECPRCGEFTTDIRDGEWFCACGEFGFVDIGDETLRSETEANE